MWGVGVAKLCLPPCFWPLSRKTEFLPWKQKCSGKIGIRVYFENRNEFFLACTWIYNAINKCKFLSSNIILWSKHHSSFSCFSNNISSIWLNCHRGKNYKIMSGSCSEGIGEQNTLYPLLISPNYLRKSIYSYNIHNNE